MSMDFFSPLKTHDSDPASSLQFNTLNSRLRLAAIAATPKGFCLNLFIVNIHWCRYACMNADAWRCEPSQHLLMVLPRNRSWRLTWLVLGTDTVCVLFILAMIPRCCMCTGYPPISLNFFSKPFHHVGSTLHKCKRKAWQLGYNLEQPNQMISTSSITHVVTTDRSLS